MPSPDKQGRDDQVLSRYLLGSLPPDETERLDELSIEDGEFALRLDAVENDLVDAYARGDLSGDALEQFQKFYLSSPRRREKAEFALALFRFGEKTPRAVPGVTTRPGIPGRKPTDETLQSPSPRRWFTVPRLDLQWGFAAAAMTLLLGSTYLFLENERLQKQAIEARNQQTALNQHTQDLERQLGEQRSANAGMLKELNHLRESSAPPRALKIVAALLLPQMRGATQVPMVSVPVGTDQVQLRLQLESDDFPVYRVALIDPGTNKVMWRSGDLKARTEGKARVVSINLQAGLLKQQNYVLELTGISSNGRAEFITSYAVKVVPE